MGAFPLESRRRASTDTERATAAITDLSPRRVGNMRVLALILFLASSASAGSMTYGANSTSVDASINGTPIAPSSLTIGSTGVAISSTPVFHICGAVIVGSLASGTTFLSFTPDSAITLIRITGAVEVAGVAGSGDTVKCNNAAGIGVSVTMTAAATAGTTNSTAGSAAIAYQGAVSCHIDSGAATRPIMTACLEYILQ